MWKYVAIALLAYLVQTKAAPTETEDDSSLQIVSRLFNDCGKEEDMSVCLKFKAVNFLDRLGRSNGSIPITDFVSIADVPNAKNAENVDEERSLEASLKQARSLDEKSATLDDLMWNKLSRLFRTKTLQLSVPTEVFEGRGKKKGGGGKGKHHGMMMMMMMAGMMMKMMIWKVGMMAGKAMMVGKAAMIMAVVMMLKKMGGGGGGESHPPVVYAAEQGGGGGWQRRYTDAQNMAYAAHQGDY